MYDVMHKCLCGETGPCLFMCCNICDIKNDVNVFNPNKAAVLVWRE